MISIKKCAYLIIITAVLGSTLTASAKDEKDAPKEAAKKEFIIPVRVAPAKKGELKDVLKLNGTIYPISSVNVSAKTAGQIIHIFHDEGDKVKAGDILLKIDDEKIAIRVKQTDEGVTAATELYKKASTATKLEEEQTELQINLATSNLSAAKALYDKAKTGARPEEKKQAEANMLSAEAAMKNAEVNYNRMKELLGKNTVSQQQYDFAKMQYDVSKAQYEIAKESSNLIQSGLREEDIKAAEANYNSATTALKIAESLKLKLDLLKNDVVAAQANLKQAEYEQKMANIMLDETLVRAPIDGVISKKFAQEGEVIQAPGIPLFAMVDQASVKVKINVPESSISKIATGLEALVETDSYPNTQFKGSITKILPTLDARLRTLEIEVVVLNKEGLLREGMFAKVSIYIAIEKNAIYLPVSAVTEREGEKFVFATKSNTPTKKIVKTGLIEGDKIQILSGVAEGESIIYQGNAHLEEGMKISIENK